MSQNVKTLEAVLEKGLFQSEVSSEAEEALKRNIKLRKKLKSEKMGKRLTLDFSEVNKTSIEKRGNLKVYQDLPKGIRVVAR